MPFEVLTTDWDGDVLEYTWEATAGQFDNTTGELVVWTAPDTPTDAKVTVSVTDGKSDPVTGTVSITVEPDKRLESDIIGTWSLVSIDNNPLSDYSEEISLINKVDEETQKGEIRRSAEIVRSWFKDKDVEVVGLLADENLIAEVISGSPRYGLEEGRIFNK